jgi:hypothetical protein
VASWRCPIREHRKTRWPAICQKQIVTGLLLKPCSWQAGVQLASIATVSDGLTAGVIRCSELVSHPSKPGWCDLGANFALRNKLRCVTPSTGSVRPVVKLDVDPHQQVVTRRPSEYARHLMMPTLSLDSAIAQCPPVICVDDWVDANRESISRILLTPIQRQGGRPVENDVRQLPATGNTSFSNGFWLMKPSSSLMPSS